MARFKVTFVPRPNAGRSPVEVVADSWSIDNRGYLDFQVKAEGGGWRKVRTFSPNADWADVAEVPEKSEKPDPMVV